MRADPGVRASAGVVLAREAWQQDDEGSARALGDLLARHLGAAGRPAPATVGAPYWMESALWQGRRGPGGGVRAGGLHADDEWGDLAQVRAFATALVTAISGFCG